MQAAGSAFVSHHQAIPSGWPGPLHHCVSITALMCITEVVLVVFFSYEADVPQEGETVNQHVCLHILRCLYDTVHHKWLHGLVWHVGICHDDACAC